MTKRVITLNPTMNTTSVYDIEALCDEWSKLKDGHQLTEIDLDEMRLLCTSCDEQDHSIFSRVESLLCKFGRLVLCGSVNTKDSLAAKITSDTVYAWRVIANLGYYPRFVEELLEAWLLRERLDMRYDGRFYRDGVETKIDVNYVGNQLLLWNAKWKSGFSKDTIFAAIDIYGRERQAEIRRNIANVVSYDPAVKAAGKDALSKLVRAMITPNSGDDPAQVYRVAEMALENTIYRVKTFLRGSSAAASAHLMVILFGEQGNGKSKFWKYFFAPIGELFVDSFDLQKLNDNSFMYQLSVYPAMLIDEMAGADKADVAHLKSVMDGGASMMREAYARAAVRIIEATFVGASNKDLRNSIKDETGNRRFVQFTTQLIDLQLLSGFDYLSIWKSVDENAKVPPMYADKSLLEDLKAMQSEQRVMSAVEQWVLSGDLPNGWFTAGEVFTRFKNWCLEEGAMSAAAGQYASAHALGTTISELAANRRYAGVISKKKYNGQNKYRIDLAGSSGVVVDINSRSS